MPWKTISYHEKKILSILEQEIEDGEQMTAAVRKIAEEMLLGEKDISRAISGRTSFDVVLARRRQV
jgi:hypothetical protein